MEDRRSSLGKHLRLSSFPFILTCPEQRHKLTNAFHEKVYYALLDDAHLLVTSSLTKRELAIYRFALAAADETAPKDDPPVPALIMHAPPAASFGSFCRNARSPTIPEAPFRPDPSLDVIAIRFSASLFDPVKEEDHDIAGTLLLPHRAIYDALARAQSCPPGTRLPWGEWAPFQTVLLNTTGVVFDAATPPAPHGARFPLLVSERGIELCGRAVAFDLNPVRARAARRGVCRAGDRRPVADEELDGFLCPHPLRANAPFVAVHGPRLFFRNQPRVVDCGGPMLLVSVLRSECVGVHAHPSTQTP